MNLKTSFLGHQLEHPLMNAAGTCKNLADVKKLATKSAVSAIMIGSITPLGGEGNHGETWVHNHPHTPYFTVNTLGLPNQGIDNTTRDLPEMSKLARENGKLLGISLAGKNVLEYSQMAGKVNPELVDFAELNLGCPNIWENGEQHGIGSFELDYMGEVFHGVNEAAPGLVFGVKVSPYTDPDLRKRFANRINTMWPAIKFVTSANTFPNSLAFDAQGRKLIKSPEVESGFGGGAGRGYLASYVGQVGELRSLLQHSVALVGVGGVYSGHSMLSHLWAGATMVGVASEYLLAENTNTFSRILAEAVEILASLE